MPKSWMVLAFLSALVGAFVFSAASQPGSLPGSVGEAWAGCKGSDQAPRKLSRSQATRATTCLVNKRRSRNGLKRLKPIGPLRTSAKRHTRQMQKQNCYAHQCPGEPALSGRLQAASYLPCNCSWSAGETLAYGVGRQGSPREIVDDWMRSSPHRDVILSGSLEHVGVGVRWGTPVKASARKAATYTLNAGYRR